MEKVIDELRSGDMTHRTEFIEAFIGTVRAIAKRKNPHDEDIPSEAYVMLCRIPEELAQGRYKNESTKAAITKYIIVRICSACRRWERSNFLVKVPYSTMARNTELTQPTRITHIFPGERFGLEKINHVPVPVFDLIAGPEPPPERHIEYVGLTGVEKRMVADIKDGMSVNAMATKYYVSRRTIRNRMDSIKSKIRLVGD